MAISARGIFVVQKCQPAKVVDVPVRNDDPLDVGQPDRLAKLGADLLQSGQQLLVGVAKAAAGVDQRRRPGVQQQVDVDDQSGKSVAGDAIDRALGRGSRSGEPQAARAWRRTSRRLDGTSYERQWPILGGRPDEGKGFLPALIGRQPGPGRILVRPAGRLQQRHQLAQLRLRQMSELAGVAIPHASV